MPLCDADIANGIFFADFGQPVVFNGVTVKGNFDAANKNAMFDHVEVADSANCLYLPIGAFSPMPTTGKSLTVAGIPYRVVAVNPIDDGSIIEFKLRAL